jgi:hypothetical protein
MALSLGAWLRRRYIRDYALLSPEHKVRACWLHACSRPHPVLHWVPHGLPNTKSAQRLGRVLPALADGHLSLTCCCLQEGEVAIRTTCVHRAVQVCWLLVRTAPGDIASCALFDNADNTKPFLTWP